MLAAYARNAASRLRTSFKRKDEAAMRRFGRWMSNGLTVLSLMLFLLLSVLWLRNRHNYEQLGCDRVKSTDAFLFETDWFSIIAGGDKFYFLHCYQRQNYFELKKARFCGGPAEWKTLRGNFPNGIHFIHLQSNTDFLISSLQQLDGRLGFDWDGNGPLRIFAGREQSACVPAWFLIGLFGAFPLARIAGFRRWRRSYRIARGRCAQCGYDLTGNISGVCPECGTVIAKKTG
jgi:hypothetical protein